MCTKAFFVLAEHNKDRGNTIIGKEAPSGSYYKKKKYKQTTHVFILNIYTKYVINTKIVTTLEQSTIG